MYPIYLKVHIAVVMLSLVLYLGRFVFAFFGSRFATHPIVVKAAGLTLFLVLLSAIGLCVSINQYPVVDGWLSEKLIGLVVYVVLGITSLKPTTARFAQLVFGAVALGAFAATITVAAQRTGFFL